MSRSTRNLIAVANKKTEACQGATGKPIRIPRRVILDEKSEPLTFEENRMYTIDITVLQYLSLHLQIM